MAMGEAAEAVDWVVAAMVAETEAAGSAAAAAVADSVAAEVAAVEVAAKAAGLVAVDWAPVDWATADWVVAEVWAAVMAGTEAVVGSWACRRRARIQKYNCMFHSYTP